MRYETKCAPRMLRRGYGANSERVLFTGWPDLHFVSDRGHSEAYMHDGPWVVVFDGFRASNCEGICRITIKLRDYSPLEGILCERISLGQDPGPISRVISTLRQQETVPALVVTDSNILKWHHPSVYVPVLREHMARLARTLNEVAKRQVLALPPGAPSSMDEDTETLEVE